MPKNDFRNCMQKIVLIFTQTFTHNKYCLYKNSNISISKLYKRCDLQSTLCEHTNIQQINT